MSTPDNKTEYFRGLESQPNPASPEAVLDIKEAQAKLDSELQSPNSDPAKVEALRKQIQEIKSAQTSAENSAAPLEETLVGPDGPQLFQALDQATIYTKDQSATSASDMADKVMGL